MTARIHQGDDTMFDYEMHHLRTDELIRQAEHERLVREAVRVRRAERRAARRPAREPGDTPSHTAGPGHRRAARPA
ncbi:hypothetical protein [Streptomyces sp. NPDC056628]|uniref:hypothetical protein n=1 Tax=Streptomyces sp. NPDC056628 TaxID=3345882 RepID=UPI00368FF15F